MNSFTTSSPNTYAAVLSITKEEKIESPTALRKEKETAEKAYNLTNPLEWTTFQKRL